MNVFKKWIENRKVFAFNDRIRLGDGVFDTMLMIVTKDKKGLHVDNIYTNLHIERLLENAAAIGISPDNLPTEKELEDKINRIQIDRPFKLGKHAINTVITRGITQRGLMPPKNCKPTIEIKISPAPDEFPPIEAIISKTVRRNEGSPLSQIKSCNYGDNILALIEARDQDANEAILLNNKGLVTCASAGNIFCCINNELVTPPLSDGVMDGVTRKIIIKKFSAIERSITEEELKNAAGIYITNSIKGIMPLISLDGKTLPEPSIKIDKDAHIENV